MVTVTSKGMLLEASSLEVPGAMAVPGPMDPVGHQGFDWPCRLFGNLES